MAKTFYVSPGRSYTVTASEGTTITYPGITKPAATVGSEGSVTFNCTGTEIVVSDDSAQIAQNFNNAGAAVAGAGGGSGSLDGVALLEGGNSFSGDQTITGDVTIDGAVTISGDVTAEGEYNGAEVIETQDTTIIPEAGKYYKYTGTGDTITIAAPVWNGYMTISYLETATPIELQGVTWSPAKPSLTGAGPFVYTLVCAESGKVLASAMNYSVATAEAIQEIVPLEWGDSRTTYGTGAINTSTNSVVIGAGANSLSNANNVIIGHNAKTNGASNSHNVIIGYGTATKGWGSSSNIVIGYGAEAQSVANIAVGAGACFAIGMDSIAIGRNSQSSANSAISLGSYSQAKSSYSTAIGYQGKANAGTAILIGCSFQESVDGTAVLQSATTEGTGSITIGAGANTLNTTTTVDGVETTVESSNSVTIGCKAENKGADSIVLGAQAKAVGAGTVTIGAGAGSDSNNGESGSVIIGAGAKGSWGNLNVIIGKQATVGNIESTAIGFSAKVYEREGVSVGSRSSSAGQYCIAIGTRAGSGSGSAHHAIAIGYGAVAAGGKSTAIGLNAKSADRGAVVFRSTAEDGTYTQLYFSGANTPLANTYHGGAPMLGYVTKDSAGNIVAAGTRSLIDLLTDNSTFAPASLDENGEWVMPKVFHPSDLDMPQEEPTEPEEYTPLPVYPIVEPEIPTELLEEL